MVAYGRTDKRSSGVKAVRDSGPVSGGAAEGIIEGAEAVRRLVDEHPDAHTFFGEHESIYTFAADISFPGWKTFNLGGCWVILGHLGDNVYDMHWFCPGGAKIKIVRAILSHVFKARKATVLTGVIPPDGKCSRESRVLARAIGAVMIDGIYVLTKDRFCQYNAEKLCNGAARWDQ